MNVYIYICMAYFESRHTIHWRGLCFPCPGMRVKHIRHIEKKILVAIHTHDSPSRMPMPLHWPVPLPMPDPGIPQQQALLLACRAARLCAASLPHSLFKHHGSTVCPGATTAPTTCLSEAASIWKRWETFACSPSEGVKRCHHHHPTIAWPCSWRHVYSPLSQFWGCQCWECGQPKPCAHLWAINARN